MKKNVMRIISIALVLVMIVTAFAGCSTKGTVQKPTAVAVKTDLKDVTFVFTYGDLRQVLPGDQLAALFETTNQKTDDKTVSISYYELVSKFGDKEYFPQLLALISDEDWAAFTANQQAVLDYFNSTLGEIKANGSAKVSYNEYFWINHGDGVVFKDADGNVIEGQDELKAAFRLYSDTALKNIGDYLMNVSQDEATDFGADLTDVIYPLGSKDASTLTLNDLYTETNPDTKVTTYPIYSSIIPNLVNDLDDEGNNAEDENGEYIFVPTELNRTICIVVKPEAESVKKAFTVREQDAILKHFEVAKNYMTVNSFEIGFTPCRITAGYDAVLDRMTYVTYEKNMVITANITFTGALAQYGNVIVEFPCTSSLTYNFGWPTKE